MKTISNSWLLVAILVIAVLLRLPLLTGSFWLDEAAQALESARPLSQQLDIIPDFQPPLMHILLHFAMYVSSSEWWLRTVGALIPGILSIFLTYKIAQQWKNERAGLIAATLLATSSFFIFYSQELRPYALPTLWAVLSWWSLVKVSKAKNNVHKLWLVYGLASVFGLYSSFLYPFLMLSQVFWVVATQKALIKHFLYAAVGIFVCFIPWLPTFKLQLQAGGLLRQDLPGWEEVVSFSQLKSLPLVGGKFIFGVVNLEISGLFVILSLALAISGLLVAGYWYHSQIKPLKLKNYSQEIVLLCWIIVPLAAAWVVSFWIPVIQPKRVLFLMPALYLLVGLVVTRIKHTKVAYSFVLLLIIINLISTLNYYIQPQLQRENWRDLHSEISQKYTPANSILVFAFPEPFAPWRWYDQSTFPTLSLDYLVTTPEDQVQEALKPATEKQFILVFDYLTDLTDPDHKLITAIESFGFKPIEVIDYPNIGFVRIYSRSGMTAALR